MVKENQNINSINEDSLKGSDTLKLINCFIDTIDLIGASELGTNLIIDSCIINNLKIHSCWFDKGFTLRNSIVKNSVDYQMGGHNLKPILIEGSIFNEFVNFFDCQFEDIIELKNNIFLNGTNLFGNEGEGFENTFKTGFVSENNLGSLDLNGEGLS